jgi:hypothetical protein
MLFLSIIFIGISYIMFFKPDIFWNITESWKSDNAYGPTDLYKFSTKFGGVMFFFIGLVGLIVQIFFE